MIVPNHLEHVLKPSKILIKVGVGWLTSQSQTSGQLINSRHGVLWSHGCKYGNIITPNIRKKERKKLLNMRNTFDMFTSGKPGWKLKIVNSWQCASRFEKQLLDQILRIVGATMTHWWVIGWNWNSFRIQRERAECRRATQRSTQVAQDTGKPQISSSWGQGLLVVFIKKYFHSASMTFRLCYPTSHSGWAEKKIGYPTTSEPTHPHLFQFPRQLFFVFHSSKRRKKASCDDWC